MNVGELLAGQSVSAKFTFNVKNDVVIGKEFKNIAKVDYYSIFNETKFDEKEITLTRQAVPYTLTMLK